MWNINWYYQHQIKEKQRNINTRINTEKLYREKKHSAQLQWSFNKEQLRKAHNFYYGYSEYG